MPSRSTPKAAAIFASAAVLTVPCGAQTVQGILLGERSHQPIANARVALVDSLGRVAAQAVTDTGFRGAFYLTADSPGRYELRIVVGRGGVSHSEFFALDSNQVMERTFVAPDWPQPVLDAYLADDVTKQAAPIPHVTRPPRYPDHFRSTGRDGVVKARMVIDSEGRPIMSTFQIIESDDRSFSESVRDAVSQSRYAPAERDGVAVSQVFDFAVDFGFGDAPPKLHGKNVMMVRALGVRYP